MEYNIPIVWESYKNYKVEADNLEEAVKLALQTFFKEPDDYYLEDSFNIDGIIKDNYLNEHFNLNKIINEL